jgi:hypothetical protein
MVELDKQVSGESMSLERRVCDDYPTFGTAQKDGMLDWLACTFFSGGNAYGR